jgi:CRISPR-associated endonuclease/helicase Cas3
VSVIDFDAAFLSLTGNSPFPWQRDLYQSWFSKGQFPDACILPTGLGKTAVVAIWLVALAHGPERVPRRLVYVVNRRTVVDQTTNEAEKMRRSAADAGVPIPAISTLRGQFADNREWSADPSRPAIIIGTVDMIGSRLLFSGYRCGFKSRPLHAGFLGQDVLLVHDEAHLEPAFQELLIAIQREQHERERAEKVPWAKLRVMELTATSRGNGILFGLSDRDRAEREVRKRIEATKAIHLHEYKDEKKLAEEIADLALKHASSGRAVLVFVRKVDDVEEVVRKLPKDSFEQLTGTLRGLERDGLVKKPIFQRFLPESNRDKGVAPAEGAVYLVCTSAGEVGVNVSADHLVCDLSTFDSMAQRFGRVNRFGDRDDTRIDVIFPNKFEDNELGMRLKRTLDLLGLLNDNGNPAALSELRARTELPCKVEDAFAPPPTILPVSDILFDAWALTTIRGKLPGRLPVEPYLHGVEDEKKAETYVAWREEVWELRREFATGTERGEFEDYAEELLEDYPLKPHELLRDSTYRKNTGVLDKLAKIAGRKPEYPVWIQEPDGTILVRALADLSDLSLAGRTVVLPPQAGGLMIDNGRSTGFFDGSEFQREHLPLYDVADELFDGQGNRRRVRLWKVPQDYETKTENMRLVRRIDVPASGEDEDEEGRSWHWFELPADGDTDGSKSNKKPVLLQVHTDDVMKHAAACVQNLPLSQELKGAIALAAQWHDLGKRRKQFQMVLGNFDPDTVLAKSGKKGGRVPELYRHEFGSLVDVLDESQPFCAELRKLPADMQEVVLHLIAVHHGYGRPHFPTDLAFDPEPKGQNVDEIAASVAQRFARLQRRYGRWGLAYLESLLRAADYAASARPSAFVEVES